MLMELTAKLKENYMVLLPETIPFLAELMEGKDTHTHTHQGIQGQENAGATTSRDDWITVNGKLSLFDLPSGVTNLCK